MIGLHNTHVEAASIVVTAAIGIIPSSQVSLVDRSFFNDIRRVKANQRPLSNPIPMKSWFIPFKKTLCDDSYGRLPYLLIVKYHV